MCFFNCEILRKSDERKIIEISFDGGTAIM